MTRFASSLTALAVAVFWWVAYPPGSALILLPALVGPLLYRVAPRRSVPGILLALGLAPACLAPWHIAGNLGGPVGFAVDLAVMGVSSLTPLSLPVLVAGGAWGWTRLQDAKLPSAVAVGDFPRRSVLVFGIDGADWQVIDGMRERLPTISGLIKRGRHGVLRSDAPLDSPVVWTTIFTGVYPSTHGVSDWNRPDARSRRVPEIWDAACAHGIRSVVVNVPGTWPPTDIRGCTMISGFPMPGLATGYSTSAAGQLAATGDIVDVGGRRLIPRWPHVRHPLIETAGRKGVFAGTKLVVEDREGWIDLPEVHGMIRQTRTDGGWFLGPLLQDPLHPTFTFHTGDPVDLERYVVEGVGWIAARDKRIAKIFPDLALETEARQTRAFLSLLPADLAVFVFTATDRLQHAFFARDRSIVEDAYAEADRALARAIAAMPPNTMVMVVSDHGVDAHDPLNRIDLNESGHRPEGVWIAAGPSVAAGDTLELRGVDVVPTLLACMGASIPKDLDGRPAKICSTSGGVPVQSWRGACQVGPVEANATEQLRSLGYVQ